MSLFVRSVRTMSKINSYVSQASAALFHIWQTKIPPVRQASLRSCLSRHSFSDGGSRTMKRVLCIPPLLAWQIDLPVPRRNAVELGGTSKRVLCAPNLLAWQIDLPVPRRNAVELGGTNKRVLYTPNLVAWQIDLPVPRRNAVELGGTSKRVLCIPPLFA